MKHEADLGSVAFHLVMALVADMATNDDERIERMQQTLASMLGSRKVASDLQTRTDMQAAYKALSRPRAKAKLAREE